MWTFIVNHFLLQTDFSSFSVQYGYAGIFIFFLTIDQLTPIPEEIPLLSIGYLCSQNIMNPIFAGLVSFISFIIVDTIYYLLSRSGSKLISKIQIGALSKLTGKYSERLHHKFGLTLILICFIPRMRMFGPIFAGISKLSFKKFIFYDGIGLAGFTAIYILVGFVFHNTLSFYFRDQKMLHHLIFASVLFVGALLFFVYKIKNRSNEKT